MTPNEKKPVHLDTSVQVELCKTEKNRLAVQDALKPFGIKTGSSYSKLEFKRVWIKRLVYLHAIAKRCKTISEFYAEIDRTQPTANHLRMLKTLLQAASAFLEQAPTNGSDLARLTRVACLIEHRVLGWEAYWRTLVDAEFNGIHCVRSSVPVTQSADRSFNATINQCRPSSIQCCVHEFFDRNRGKFGAIAREFVKVSTEGSEGWQAAKIIEQATTQSSTLCDDRVCRKIGDALNAVDSGDVETLCANNDREWVPISIALGKTLLNPAKQDPLREPKTAGTATASAPVNDGSPENAAPIP